MQFIYIFYLFRTTTVSEHMATVGRNNIILNKKTIEDHLQQTWQNTNYRKDETDVNDM